jgi:hypothetical protein
MVYKQMSVDDEIEKIKERKKKPTPIDVTKENVVVDAKTVTKVKKSDPTFYNTLEEIAMQENKPVEEVIKESVLHGLRMKQFVMSDMTVDQLYTAWLILSEMMDFSRELFFKYAKLMFSDETRNFLELRTQIAEETRGQLPPQPTETVKSPKDELRERMMTLFNGIMDGVMNTMMQSMGMKVPKLNIPVEYKEVKNDEQGTN